MTKGKTTSWWWGTWRSSFCTALVGVLLLMGSAPAWAAWSFVTSSGASSNAGTASSPLTLTLGAACAIDDRVIVVGLVEQGTSSTPAITSITATFSGTFTKDAETNNIDDGGTGAKVSIWSAPVTSAGTPVLTITYSDSNGTAAASGGCWRGLSTAVGSSAVDVTAAATHPTTADASPTVTVGATSAANELGIGGFGDDGWAVTFTAGSGYTRRAFQAAVNGDSAIEDKDTGTSGSTPTMNGTLGGGGSTWGMVGVVYKLAAGGGGGGAAPKNLTLMGVGQ